MKSLFLLSIFFLYNSAVANSLTKVTWITDGKVNLENFQKSHSVNTSIDTINLLANAIQRYQISLEYSPLSRMNKLLDTRDNICVINRVKTSHREKFATFSLPVNLYLGLRLYYIENETSDTQKIPKTLLNNKGQLTSLKQLFKLRPLQKLALGKGRSYGETLDEEIRNLNPQNLYIRAGENRSTAMINMLSQGRINFLIESPIVMNNLNNILKKSITFKSIAIAKTPRFFIGYLACDKGSQTFIDDINLLLLNLYKTDEFYQAHTKYLDQSDFEKFSQYYQEVFVDP